MLGAQEEVQQARRPRPQHPDGFEPGVEWNGTSGRITAPSRQAPDWRALLSAWELDPEVIEVVDDTVQMRSWDANVGDGRIERLYYYRANLRLKRDHADIEELVRIIQRRKPYKPPPPDAQAVPFVLLLADPQIGKFGTPDMVQRFRNAVDEQVQRLRDLRKLGYIIDTLVLGLLGDLIEGCKGHYAQQTFTVMLNKREQRRLGRWMVWYIIDAFRVHGVRILVVAVPGNHGEERDENGQSYTTFGDNSDLEIPETVREACERNPDAYGHITFRIPQEVMTITVDIDGVICGFAHGHQAKRGINTQKKLEEWWKDQAFGNRPVGDAAILFSGHYHSLTITEHSQDRLHIQAPTLDSGSQWFAETAGRESAAGLTSLLVSQRFRQGWSGLHVT